MTHHRTNTCTGTCINISHKLPDYIHPLFKKCFYLKKKLHRDCINQLIMKIRIICNTTQWIKTKKIYRVHEKSSHDLMIKKATLKTIVRNVIKKKSTTSQFLLYL